MGKNDLDESSAAETPSTNGIFTLSQDPVVFGEGESAHKFEIAPEPVTSIADFLQEPPAYEDLGELPATYHEDTLFLVARDPRWLFAYWDFDWTPFPLNSFRGGVPQFFLKLITQGGTEESVTEIKPEARNWYLPVNHSNTGYYAQIGYFSPSGTFTTLVSSPMAFTPGEAIAPEAEAEFATVPAHLTFERLLEMVKEHMAEGESLLSVLSRIAGEGRLQFRGGQAPTWTDDQKKLLAALLGDSLVDTLGMGSEEIDMLLRKTLAEKLSSEVSSFSLVSELLAPGPTSLFSGITSWGVGASWSAQPFSVKRERGFFMHVNAEIIFYGGTDPDATVWVDGKEIKLAADGTFRYHFTLPDGDFAIPIVAQSPDKVEQRSATLSFVRGTSKIGKVDDTGQPGYLAPLIGKKK